jgi:hypothetical protein
LLHRSSAAPHSTMTQLRDHVFLRRDLRQRADYFANPSLPLSSNYKGFPTFVKQNSLVAESRSD